MSNVGNHQIVMSTSTQCDKKKVYKGGEGHGHPRTPPPLRLRPWRGGKSAGNEDEDEE